MMARQTAMLPFGVEGGREEELGRWVRAWHGELSATASGGRRRAMALEGG
jgi:hypothetical protein